MAVRKDAGKNSPAKKSAASGGGKKKSFSGGGKKYSWIVLFWLVFAIFVFGLFIFNRDAIFNSVQIVKNEMAARKNGAEETSDDGSTGPHVSPAVPRPLDPPPAVSQPAASPRTTAAPSPPVTAPHNTEPSRQSPAAPSASAPEKPSTPPLTPASQPVPVVTPQTTPAVSAPPQAGRKTETRERPLYFIHVDRGGVIVRIKVNRIFPLSDTPMVDVIRGLIAGPNAEEKQKGLISLIPPETRILSATVRGNTAYISFSEDFLYNTYGVDGYAGQVRQIVFSTTEFPNVTDVQILIEGRRVDYLGESVWIGSPLGRNAFD